MSPRSLALVVAAVAVLGMGVYLFIQVRSTPAEAEASGETRPAPRVPHTDPPPPEHTADTSDASRGKPDGSAKVSGGEPHHTDDRPQIKVGNDVIDPTADPNKPNPRLDSMMELANKAYDRQDFDEARAIAGKLLSKDPNNVRMLRIMVSAACVESDGAAAQPYYEKLPKPDRDQMKTRCDRYGVTFKEPAQ